MVQLQNGCACCSLSDELITSVAQLVQLSDLRQSNNDDDNNDNNNNAAFDHIVVELSGVADPKQVRAKFQENVLMQMPLMERVRLDTLVTLVDASEFQQRFRSKSQVSQQETPELFFEDGRVPSTTTTENEEEVVVEEEEWMKDLPPKLYQAVVESMNRAKELQQELQQHEQNGVADLLVSQTETADLIILNKCDLCPPQTIQQLQEICTALNPRAKLLQTSYGKIDDISSVLAIAKGTGVAVAGAVDDHRDYVTAATTTTSTTTTTQSDSHSHSHDHSPSSDVACQDPDCTDVSHSHSHSHDHKASSTTSTTSSSSNHSHSHDHDVASDASCTDPDCTDTSHSHSHDHAFSPDDACTDPDCTDTSHSHSHDHATMAPNHAGIGTFVYRARRPFHPRRLVSFLKALPVVRGIPEMSEDNNNDNDDGNEKTDETDSSLEVSPEAAAVLKECLRSKGFCWSADSHISAMYWSHAGSSFEYTCLGQWWATLPRNKWPPDVHKYVLQDFDDPEHDEPNNVLGVGDRRQEIVFIGPGYDSPQTKEAITTTLDQCLLNDDEYQEYQSLQSDEDQLQAKWATVMESKYLNY